MSLHGVCKTKYCYVGIIGAPVEYCTLCTKYSVQIRNLYPLDGRDFSARVARALLALEPSRVAARLNHQLTMSLSTAPQYFQEA